MLSGFLNSGLAVPAGAVQAFAGSSAPKGWLPCDGSAISRTQYKKLFAFIGETYGAGDGATTFNLPDLRGEFIRGHDAGRGVDAGRGFGSSQGGQIESHDHGASSDIQGDHGHGSWTDIQGNHTHNQRGGYNTMAYGGGSNWLTQGGGDFEVKTTTTSGAHSHTVYMNDAGSHSHNISINATGGNETRPRNIAMIYCIKF